MPYDISKDYVAVSDGYKGTRLIPRPHLQHAIDRFYGVKTTDALPNTTNPKTGFKQATKPQNTIQAEPAEGGDGETEDQGGVLGAIGAGLGAAVGLANAAGSYANEDSRKRKRVKSRGSWDQLPGSARPAPMKSQSTGPGYDEDPDTDEDEQVLAVLPPAPGMTYILRPDPDGDGSVAVVAVPDDGGQIQANTGDNRKSWSDSKTRSVLSRINKANRAYHTRDAATQETTLMTYYPGKSQSLALRQDPGVDGKWKLVLVSRTDDLISEVPQGSEDFSDPSNSDEQEQRQGGRSDTPETGELRATSQRRMTGDHATALKLRQMNATNRRYWSSGGSAA